MSDRPVIIPEMKVAQLLESYPELEQTLIEIAPSFSKLKNPALRKTIAKLTTLRQAAKVGGVSLGEMVATLRRAAGIEGEWSDDDGCCGAGSGAPGGESARGDKPDWVANAVAVETFDAREMIEGGGHPLPQVMGAVQNLADGGVYVLVTPFEPAPLIDKARQIGAEAWLEQTGPASFSTWFRRG